MAEGTKGTCLPCRVSVPEGSRVFPMGRPQWQPWGPAQEMSPVGVPLCSHGAHSCLAWGRSSFLPGEGAFPAFLWSDLVSQCQLCAVPAVCPRSQRALAHLHRGSGLVVPRSGAGVVGGKANGGIGIWGGPWAPRSSSIPRPASSSQALLGAPSAALVPGGRGAAWLRCGVLAGKAQRIRPLHKAALFRTNPPRIGLHFCQVIHQHVNGKGWSPLNQ